MKNKTKPDFDDPVKIIEPAFHAGKTGILLDFIDSGKVGAFETALVKLDNGTKVFVHVDFIEKI